MPKIEQHRRMALLAPVILAVAMGGPVAVAAPPVPHAVQAMVETQAMPGPTTPADPNRRLDNMVARFQEYSQSWTGKLQGFALRLFWLLATIEFMWTGITLALKGAGFSEWMAEVVNRIMFIGFFLALLLNSQDWASRIVQSFRDAGGAVAGNDLLQPSNIFNAGVQLAGLLLKDLSITEVGHSLALVVGGIVVLIVFALLAAFMILALIESYVVISAGVLLMGFGGSRWTKDYAMKVVTCAMSVGAKLFVLELLLGLGRLMVLEWTNQFPQKPQNIDMMMIVGMSIVLLALAKSVPDMVQGLINGTHVGSGAALMGAAAGVAAGATGVAAGLAGGGFVVGSAMKLAREQVVAGGGGGALATAVRTVSNIAGAARSDISARLSGRAHHGQMPWRMTEAMGEQTKQLQAARQKPEAPSIQQAQPAGAGKGGGVIRPATGRGGDDDGK